MSFLFSNKYKKLSVSTKCSSAEKKNKSKSNERMSWFAASSDEEKNGMETREKGCVTNYNDDRDDDIRMNNFYIFLFCNANKGS